MQQSAGPHPHLWHLAHDCVPLDQKKVAQLPPLRTTLVAPDPKDTTSPILELEERMAQVCSTKPTTLGWGWRCAESADKWSPGRLGIGTSKTGQRLWQAMAEGYRQGPSFTDFWAASMAVSPSEQQTAVGKERGATAPVERWNNTLRQRLARFVRMTLSFSKSVLMHEACLLLFLHRSNRERAILLK